MKPSSVIQYIFVQEYESVIFKACLLCALFLNLATAGFGQTADPQAQPGERTISYVQPDGTIRTLPAQADADEDGISNELEIDGYYYCRREGIMHAATQPCDGVMPTVTYKTDPDRWSTDGDPYSDFTEVSGVNMHPAVTEPENHPLVAASPVIVVQMPTYTIIPNGEITDTEGGSRSEEMSQEASVGVEVGYSETVGAEVGTGGMNASASATLSMSVSASFTVGSSVTNEVNWNRARSVNPSEAAYLSLGVFFENRGSAPILNLQTQFNVVLGGKIIATITPDLTVNTLAPGERFPAATSPYVVVERDHLGEPIALTLEELKIVQLGAPLSLEVTQVNGKIGRWDSNTQSFDNDVDWSSWSANIEPVVVNLHADLGDGENYLYKIYAGTALYDPGLTFRDIVSLVFDVEENGGQYTIDGRPYPENWFVTSPSQAVQDEWNAANRPQSLMNVRMRRNTILSMKSPGSQTGPRINLATFTPDFRHVLVNAFPRAFPILSARAEVMVNGEKQNVTLVKDGAFYTNAEPFSAPADVDGMVYIKDVKADISEASTVLPAFYTNAQDIIDFSSFLPVPGGDEYLIFVVKDTAKPAILYCDFSFAEDNETVIGKEYLTLRSNDSTNFTDQSIASTIERVHFNKIRLDPNTLRVDGTDLTFTEFSGNKPTFNEPIFGSVYRCSPFEELYANTDLTGTPFHLDPFLGFSGGTFTIDSLRKVLQVFPLDSGTVSPTCGSVGIIGNAVLVYDDYKELAIKDGLAGQALRFNVNGTGESGYINMGSSGTLEISDAITLEAWVKPEKIPGQEDRTQVLMNREGEYEIFWWSDGTIRWALANSSPGWTNINTNYHAEPGEWLHVALTYDRFTENGAIKTYINGELYYGLYGSGAIGDFSAHVNQDEFWVGSRQASPQSAFNGSIDEVRVWNIARTQTQIQSAIGDTLGPEIYLSPESGLIGYWRFDELEDLGIGGDGADDVRDFSVNGNHGDLVGDVQLSDITTDVEEEELILPQAFMLEQNYPNPFNPQTQIRFVLPEKSPVRLQIFNLKGQKVATVLDGIQSAGQYIATWSGRDDAGRNVASGVYVYRLQAGGFVETRKMILVR